MVVLAGLSAASHAAPTKATSSQQGSSSSSSSVVLPPNPWSFGFQCNERYLDWDKSAQIALIKIWLAEKMEITVPEVGWAQPAVQHTLRCLQDNIQSACEQRDDLDTRNAVLKSSCCRISCMPQHQLRSVVT
jgi:hypothetical protein